MELASSGYSVDMPISGELLNDEPEFAGEKALDPAKTYRVRYSWRGREFLGEWDWDKLADQLVAEFPGGSNP